MNHCFLDTQYDCLREASLTFYFQLFIYKLQEKRNNNSRKKEQQQLKKKGTKLKKKSTKLTKLEAGGGGSCPPCGRPKYLICQSFCIDQGCLLKRYV